jgi:hypothetical protein
VKTPIAVPNPLRSEKSARTPLVRYLKAGASSAALRKTSAIANEDLIGG